MHIESSISAVNAPLADVLNYISIPSNLLSILPSDKVQEFESSETSCQFKVQGGIIISLVLDQVSNQEIYYKSGSKSPFPFTMTIKLNGIDSTTCSGMIIFNGEASTFVSMIAKGPLTALFQDMAKRVKEIMEEPK
jgi:hypothetical protein